MSIANLNTGQFIAFHPATGKPLALGRVFFYEPGTTTPKAVYTTRAADVQHPSPLILSATGTARVFMDGEYDIRIEDANSVLVQTLSGVYGALDEASVQEAIDAAVSAVSFGFGTITVTADTTLAASAAGKLVLIDATSGNVTVTLPAAAGMADAGPIYFLRTDATGNTVTLDGNASETVGGTATRAIGIGGAVDIYSDGSNWRVFGQISRVANFTSGTLDGVTIGGSTPAAATVTDFTVNGVALLSRDNPILSFDDTSGSTATHRRTYLTHTNNAFSINTANSTGTFVATDVLMNKSESGLSEFLVYYQGNEYLRVDGQGVRVTAGALHTGRIIQNGLGINSNIGTSSARFGIIYLTNSPDVSSDARLKDNIADLTDAERRAAAKIKTRTYTLKATGKKKVGYIAQEVIAAMASEGLDALEYGLVTLGDEGGRELYGVDYDAINAFRLG